MDTPETTLLIVLQVVSWILTVLMFIAAQQARHREGVDWWVAGFAIQAFSQFLRVVVGTTWGHQAGLPFGHVGGPLGYAMLYMGVRRYLGLPPKTGFAIGAIAIAVVLSVAPISQGMNFLSLALTACMTSLFQALSAAAFWETWQRDRGLARFGATAIFAISAATSLARAISVAPVWHVENSSMPPNTFWLLLFIALNIWQAGSLLFLVNQSLLDALQNMADHDALTGLLNRGGLSRRMQRRSRRAGSAGTPCVGVLCMDLDHFKLVNDSYGHGAGDNVLKCLGKLLRENSRPMDLASRQGGEEFCMVVEAGTADELLKFAERLRTAVESPACLTRAGPVPITISIGAALSADSAESLEDLGERADRALMQAKRSGRNRVVLAE